MDEVQKPNSLIQQPSLEPFRIYTENIVRKYALEFRSLIKREDKSIRCCCYAFDLNSLTEQERMLIYFRDKTKPSDWLTVS
jgi:hypothetical protein